MNVNRRIILVLKICYHGYDKIDDYMVNYAPFYLDM